MFSILFDFKPHSLVNFVGGGGKTILIYRLMEEFVEKGHVLYTTTTRIHPPEEYSKLAVISGTDLNLLKTLVAESAGGCTERNYKFVATQQFMEPDLLKGVPADFLVSLDRSLFAMILNEADGSARFSIKLPREGEPVLMKEAEYLVPVIGIDCLNQPAGPDTLFRFRTEFSRFSVRENEPITPGLAAEILMHPQGVCRHWKEGMTVIPFINKVDTPELDGEARTLASLILRNGTFPVHHVVWGSVRHGRSGSVSES